MNKKIILITLLIYKFILMNIALFILAKFTLVGDNKGFVDLGFLPLIHSHPEKLSLSTIVTQYFVYFVRVVLLNSGYLTNLFFNLLSFVGIYLAIAKVKLERNLAGYLFLAVLFLPNFSLWSSVASKETLVILFSGLVIWAIADYFESGKCSVLSIKNRTFQTILLQLLFFLSVGLLFFYKPAFSLFLIPLFGFIFFSENTKLKNNRKIFVYLLLLLFFVLLAYRMRDGIDYFTQHIHEAFPDTARSNRSNIWTYQYSFFYKLPYAMFLSVWGPLPSELNTLFKTFTFAESVVLVGCYFSFLFLFVRHYSWKIQGFVIPFILICSIVLCLITMTPMGTYNPGTAIRYRTNNYLYLLIFFYYLSYPKLCYERKQQNSHLC